MPILETGRHHLPLLAVSQAQKEITHNEALVLIDALLHPVAEDRLSFPPAPIDADIGKCWLVGASAQGAWTGRTDHIAIWIGGGWRFLVPCAGMRLRLLTTGSESFWSGAQWLDSPTIADATGGTVIDAEARRAIALLLQHFRLIGQVTP
jgi:Protein of unknown function (DUF2793)